MSVPLQLVSSLEAAKETVIHEYLNIWATTFLFYDHLITLDVEIDYFWRRPKPHVAYWFFLNRYLGLFGNSAITVFNFMNLSQAGCKKFDILRELLLIINAIVVNVLLTLRTYAIYNRSKRVLSFMVFSGCSLGSVAWWLSFVDANAPPVQSVGCYSGITRGIGIRYAAAWETLLAYDTIIFSLTMFKTWHGRRDFARSGMNIPSLIFRDGALYYAAMAMANLANILTFYFSGPFLKGCMSTFASAISVTLMSRLMLNLRETAGSNNIQISPSLQTPRTSHTVEPSPNWHNDFSHAVLAAKGKIFDIRRFNSDPPMAIREKPRLE